eukprot:CAMPEP_0198137260 /NCGR_PEP_ID=MMETSP1443-20131203/779_1 /TAXON_ID=186043 /ORGANISM="Entomoneis sp., Strain CCMP2396" /LENGTH=246 /DNA_ID=CAMNT_0043798633 /DNA_START=46 /DNA_END=786 /DNA_ORIENTATION=+
MLMQLVTIALLLVPSLGFAPSITRIKRCQSTCSSSTSLAMGLTLYGHPGTRSPLVNWACYELGVEVAAGDLSKNPHPFGQIPCLTDDNDVTVFESGAILSYLIQTYPPETITAAQKAIILSWIVWANASLDPICFLETPDGKVYDTGLKQPNKRVGQLEKLLQEQGGLLVPSFGFSIADVAVASYLLYVVQFFPTVDLSRWPNVVKFMKESASRPAYARAFGQDLQESMVGKLSDAPTQKKMFGMF